MKGIDFLLMTMNTISIISLVAIALCVAYIAYCIIGAVRLSRRHRTSPPKDTETNTNTNQ